MLKFGLWLREHYCKFRGVKHILENVDVGRNKMKMVLNL